MRFTFIDTFFAGAEFSSVYRLGNLFCTVPFRKITFLIDQVGFFLSIDSIFCSLKTGIHNVPSTNSQSRKMQSHDRRSWLTWADMCQYLRSSFFAGWYTGSPNSVGFRYKPMYEKKEKKQHKIRPKFFLLQKIEIFLLVSSFSTHIIAKLHFLLIGFTLLS